MTEACTSMIGLKLRNKANLLGYQNLLQLFTLLYLKTDSSKFDRTHQKN